MTSRITIAIIALLLVVCQRAQASDALRVASHVQPCIVLKISNLRSAYLLRAGVVSYDGTDRTSEGLRQQLRRHFDVVLSLLDLATPDGIETAAARLEAADDHTWTAEERNGRRQELLAARRVQLERLAAYRDRGNFPLNEGQSARPAPIFVDRHGTACAVGYLMRCSGWSDVIDSIERSNNLVYVPDATRSAIASWVLTSGLTLEEAALIQPGYHWPAGQFDASAYEPGESVLEKEGLRFSNFRLQGTGATLAGLGLSAGKGTFISPGSTPFPQHVPDGTNWIAVGGTTSYVQTPLHSLRASAPGGQTRMIEISFDVAAIDPDQRINGISESNYPYWQGFQDSSLDDFPPAGAVYYLKTNALDGPNTLASLNIDQSTPGSYFTREWDTQSFAATQQISVQSSLLLQNGVAIDTYLLDFNVITVPEPANGVLAAVLVTACRLLQRRANADIQQD